MTLVQSKTVSFSVGKVAGTFGPIGGLARGKAVIGRMSEVRSPGDISDHSSTPVISPPMEKHETWQNIYHFYWWLASPGSSAVQNIPTTILFYIITETM